MRSMSPQREVDYDLLIDLLDKHRIRKGWTQQQLANALGVGRGMWYKVRTRRPAESGRPYGFSPDRVVRIAHLLGVDPLTLYRDRERAAS